MGDLGSVTTAQNNTFFVYFLFFFQFQTSLQHIWQWWTQWDGGSRGSLLKEQLWLSWKMSMQTTGGMLCKDLQALCNACTKWSHLVMEQLCGKWRMFMDTVRVLSHNTGLFSLKGVWQEGRSHLCVSGVYHKSKTVFVYYICCLKLKCDSKNPKMICSLHKTSSIFLYALNKQLYF